jgi:hypothetical protein
VVAWCRASLFLSWCIDRLIILDNVWACPHPAVPAAQHGGSGAGPWAWGEVSCVKTANMCQARWSDRSIVQRTCDVCEVHVFTLQQS